MESPYQTFIVQLSQMWLTVFRTLYLHIGYGNGVITLIFELSDTAHNDVKVDVTVPIDENGN